MPTSQKVSVVITTYNRGELLGDAIRSVLQQQNVPEFELLVVDNNSKDATRSVVERMIPESGGRLRYVFEAKQGASHGRNAGIEQSSGDIIAFTDDDVRADPTWLATILSVFEEYPDAAFVGGRVLPMWPAPVPSWLDKNHWSPLALVDYGDEVFKVNDERPICLVSASLGVRRSAFEKAGGFDPHFQHLNGAVSSIEDQELQLRMIRHGLWGIYSPRVIMHAEVQKHRLDKAYHRKWHFQHGRVSVRLLGPGESFNSSMLPESGLHPRSVFSVPTWTIRQFVEGLGRTALSKLSGQTDKAFINECAMLESVGLMSGFRNRAKGI